MTQHLNRFFNAALLCALVIMSIFASANQSFATTTTLILSPDADAYVDRLHSTYNFGGSSILKVVKIDYNSNTYGYLRFNLSSIPSNAVILDATLLLYLKSKSLDPTSTINLYLASNNRWNELLLNWDNKPDTANLVYTNNMVAFQGQWQSWSVTDAVRNASDSMISFILVSTELTGENIFSSKESLEKPKLELTLQLPNPAQPAIGAVTMLPVKPSSEDTVQVSAEISNSSYITAPVELRYRVDKGNWASIEMSQNASFFKGEIPRQKSGSTVEYLVETAYGDGNNLTSTVRRYQVDRPTYYYNLKDDYTSLKAQLDRLAADYNSLQPRMDLLRLNNSNLAESQTELRLKIRSLEQSYQQLKDQLDSATANLEPLEKRLNQTQLELSRSNATKISLQERLKQVQNELNTVSKELAEAESKLTESNENLQWSQSELNSTKTKLLTTASQLSFSQTQLQNAKNDYSNTQGRLTQWQMVGTIALGSVVVAIFVLRKAPQKSKAKAP